MASLLCVGDLNLDVAITITDELALGSDTDGTVEIHGGGSAANVAAWAARAGCPTRFVGAVGDDTSGDFLVDELTGHGVDVRVERRPDTRSRAIASIVGSSGDRSMVSDRDRTDRRSAARPSAQAISVADLDDAVARGAHWLDGVAWLHLTAYTHLAEHSRPLALRLCADATARGVPFSIDPSAAQLLRDHGDLDEVLSWSQGAAVLFPNHDEAAYLTGDGDPHRAAERLLDLAEVVAVTCGSDGAVVASRDGATLAVPAGRVEVVSTLGCGDAFAGGFLAARLRQGIDVDLHACTVAAIEQATVAATLPSAR